MFTKKLAIGVAVLVCAALIAGTGCCSAPECVKTVQAPPPPPPPPAPIVNPCGPSVAELPALPPNARPGECWGKIYVPPTYRTITERVLVRDQQERVEVIPAEYEWVEEKVLAKEASSELQVMPAQLADRTRTIEVEPAHTDWEVNKAPNCKATQAQPAKDVFCLVNHPPVQRAITEQVVVKPATVMEKVIPAEYQTVRRQRLVHAATSRKTCIPAEYATVDKQVKVCDGRIAWQRVICEEPGTAVTLNEPR